MKTIIVISGKGGVGKTLVSVLTAQKLRSGLVDLDVDSSSVPKVLDIESRSVELTRERKLVPIEVNEMRVNSLGAVMSDSAISQPGEYYRQIVRDVLTNTDWGGIDYLVIDMPPGGSDIFRECVDITKKDNTLIGALVVGQSRESEDARRVYEICKRLYIPIIGFVENMSGMVMHGAEITCSCGCGEKFAPFGQGGIESFSKEVGGKFLGKIPLSDELTKRPPEIDPVTDKTVSKIVKELDILGVPELPEDKVRKSAGTVKFVHRAIKSLFSLGKKISQEYDISAMRSRHGREEPGVIEIQVTDCPESLSEYRTIYIRLGKEVEFLKPKSVSNSEIIGGIKLGSGPLSCVLQGKINVMNPFTKRAYTEDYSFTKAVNSGDIEIYGEKAFNELLLFDNLLSNIGG